MPLNRTSICAELTDEQAELIGRLVTEGSNIEELLGVLLSRLLFIPSFLARVCTDEITASRLQGAISKAVVIQRLEYGCQVITHDT